ELDRMLLHSWATCRVNPGIVRKTPFWATGTRITTKSAWAAQADPSCNKDMILSNAIRGTGIRPNKKQSGNNTCREAAVPNQNKNAAIHHTTRASMATESRTSGAVAAT